MEQPGSGKSEADLKKSFAGGSARNVLQSAGTGAGGSVTFIIESWSMRLFRVDHCNSSLSLLVNSLQRLFFYLWLSERIFHFRRRCAIIMSKTTL